MCRCPVCKNGVSVVQICEYCGNLAETTTNKMCPACRKEYQQIRQLVVDHPNITIIAVSQKTGVSVSKIQTFVRKGWFIMGEGIAEQLE